MPLLCLPPWCAPACSPHPRLRPGCPCGGLLVLPGLRLRGPVPGGLSGGGRVPGGGQGGGEEKGGGGHIDAAPAMGILTVLVPSLPG
jgi:hypothetical protein